MQQSKVFLSYSWANTDIADIIDQDFERSGITLIRDIRDAHYRTNLKEFMGKIKSAEYVVMLIGDDFLKSQNCMFEVMELLNSREFEKRILPVSIGDANIFTPNKRIKYYDFWDEKIEESRANASKYETTDFSEQLKHQKDIRNNLPDFFTRVTSLNIKTFDELKKVGYRPIFEVLGFLNAELYIRLQLISHIKDIDSQETELENLLTKFGPHYLIYFDKAIIYKKERKYNASRLYFEKAIKIAPGNYPNLYNDYGLLLEFNFQEFENAKINYEIALKIQPTLEAAILNYTNLISNHYNDYDAAKSLWESGIKVNPNNIKFHNNLAALLVDKFKDYEQALTHYKITLDIDPLYINGAVGAAIILDRHLRQPIMALPFYDIAFQKNQSESFALKYLDSLIELDLRGKLSELLVKPLNCNPSVRVYHKYAQIAVEIFNDKSNAESWYKKAVKLDNTNSNSFNEYGIFAEYRLLDYLKAKKNYLKAIKLNPQKAIYHYNYAYLIDQHFEMFELSEKHYKLAIAYNANELDAYINLGDLLRRSFRFDESIDFFRQAITINPKHPLAYLNLGDLLAANPETLKESIDVFQKGIAENPLDERLKLYLGDLLLKIGRFEEAEDEFKNLVALTNYGTDPTTRYTYCLIKQNKYQLAEDVMLKAINAHPYNLNFLNTYITVLGLENKVEEALHVFEQSIELNAVDAVINYNGYLLYKDINPTKSEIYLAKAKELGIDDYLS